MKRITQGLLVVALGLFVASSAMAYTGTYVPGAGINGTPHDMGTPGANGMNYEANPADTLTRRCIFCHAPHNTTPVRPLWNRSMPIDSYLIYSSRALDAQPGQPTGHRVVSRGGHRLGLGGGQ